MNDDFKIGSRVILTSHEYNDAPWNPRWGGSSGNVVGGVIGCNDDDGWISVYRDNGQENDYAPDDLSLYVKSVNLPEDLFTI